MGMLGAMAGLGQGMQGYATSMRQTQQNNWVSEQDAAKHERQVSLENLRASNQNKANQDRMEFQGAEAEKGREFQLQRDKDNNQLADKRLATQNEVVDGRKVVGKNAQGIDITLSELEAMDDTERKKVMGPEAWKVQMELSTQEKLMTQAKKFSADERMEKATALREIWAQDGLSPMEEIKLTAIENGIDMKDIIGTSKPMSAEMVKNLDTMLSQDKAYMNADAVNKISMMRDAYAKLVGGAQGTQQLKPEAVQSAIENWDKLTEADKARIPPAQLEEIVKAVNQPGPAPRQVNPGRTQGQQYQDQVVGDMSLTKGVMSGYNKMKDRFTQLRSE